VVKKEKVLLAILIIIVCSTTISAIDVKSCQLSEIKTAISNANPGETINVPAGTCTWDGSLLIDKGVNLIGAGIDKTIIRNSGSCSLGFQGEFWLQYEPSDYSLNTPFRLSGFTFDINNHCGAFSLGQTGKHSPFPVQTKIRIDNNRWIHPGGIFIWNAGDMYGVIDSNIFEGSDYSFKNDPQADESSWFENAPQNVYSPGSGNNLYYEDNTISLGGDGSNVLAECQYGGRYVFRYNSIANPIPSYSLFELHGHQSSGSMPSCFGAEVYGNLVNAGSNQIILFKVRGGKSFIYLNAVNSGSLSNAAYTSLVTCPTSNPSEQMIHDTFWWLNRKGLTGGLSADDISGSIACDGRSGIPMPGRDIVTDSTNPGVGCGTSLPSSCSVNQGYWLTTQSCLNLAGMVGTNPQQPISGTLYKCTRQNTWTAFYTPYAYPHPLRGDCIPSCTGKACGDDGCGGSCGKCQTGDTCNSQGQCVATCTPSCIGKVCGDNGCGGSCGTCQKGYMCNAQGQCASGLQIEAEAGQITEPMKIIYDTQASGGNYVSTPNDESGSVSFTFTVEAGSYILQARVSSASTDADSFYVGLDSEVPAGDMYYAYAVPIGGYAWDNVSRWASGSPPIDPMLWGLSAGTHIFTFNGREKGAKLDAVRLFSTGICEADLNADGCIGQDELLQYIIKWKSGQVTLTGLMEACKQWRNGC